MIIAFIYSMIKNLFLPYVRFLRIRAKTTHLDDIQRFETLASKTFTIRNKQYCNVRIANTYMHVFIVISFYECCFFVPRMHLFHLYEYFYGTPIKELKHKNEKQYEKDFFILNYKTR